MDIEYNNNLYLITKDDDDNNKLLADRGWFISHSKPDNTKEFNKYNKMSIFYRNMKHKGMKYPTEINNTIVKHPLINI